MRGAAPSRSPIEAGGRRLIRVVDDGHGMAPEDLELAVERHATSKLPDGDLFAIATLGFRGEALPSIGAVARLADHDPHGGRRDRLVHHGRGRRQGPGAARPGAARHADRGDGPLRRDAGAPEIPEERPLRGAGGGRDRQAPRHRPSGDPLHARGRSSHAVHLSAGAGGGARLPAPSLAGARARVQRQRHPDRRRARGRDASAALPGLPTFHRGASTHIHFVVNGRPVRDKLLLGAVRGAYADVMPSDRHPVLALMIDLDPRAVDVNVHPAKTEVRFRDPAFVRGLVVAALKEAITRSGFRAATTGGTRTLESLRPEARRRRVRAAAWPAPRDHRSGTPSAFAGWQAPLDRRARMRRASRSRKRAFGEFRRALRRQPGSVRTARRSGSRCGAARRGARAGPRHLHRRADAGRHRHRRPARGP